MRRAKWLCVVVLPLLAGGCATLTRGESQKMMFESDPPGATVSIDGRDYTTPVEVELLRKAEHRITVSKPGHRSVVFDMKSQWDGASLPNFLFPGGSLAMATDTTKGADRAFYSVPKITLEPVDSSGLPPIELIHYKGRLLTQEQYEQVRREEWEDVFYAPRN